ncbi:MAG TPA: class 1 fructose-bisphosphatase [Marinagarivorans sp.]
MHADTEITEVLQADGVPQSLIDVISALLTATQNLAVHIARGPIIDANPNAPRNVHGEAQTPLDGFANQTLKNALSQLNSVAALASEEEPKTVPCHPNGQYVVAFDPLDGSSNIAVNGPIGTIFTIYPRLRNCEHTNDAHFLQPGRQQLCAGYVLYGPATQCVLSTGGATRGYTLLHHHKNATPLTGEAKKPGFYLTRASYHIAKTTQEFAINMAHQFRWQPWLRNYIAGLMAGPNGPRKKAYTMRWSGAMVADVHRVISRGGIFMYPLLLPAAALNHSAQQSQTPTHSAHAKLRLLYEANPMALLIEGAGGLAYSQSCAILDITPEAIHQKDEVILGSADEVQYCLTFASGSV